MWGSSNSLCMGNNNQISPIDINKIHIRTKRSEIGVTIPFLSSNVKNVFIESFQVQSLITDNQTNIQNSANQFYLFCDNAKGFHRTNGKQTLLTAISNWDGDANHKVFSILNSQPFQLQKTDNHINFVITKATSDQDLYPQETEGTPFPAGQQDDYLFNIILNILPAEE